ncbi:hypothetical protein GCM10020256_09590 [Streptomyces thermocoprophilus]
MDSGDWIAARMSFMVTVLPPAVRRPEGGALRGTSVLLRVVFGVPSVRRVVLGFGSALWRGRVPVTQASGARGPVVRPLGQSPGRLQRMTPRVR